MAQLAAHRTLDNLLATIRDLEARVLELKRTANEMAKGEQIALPYPGVEMPRVERPPLDMSGGPVADAQD